MKPLAYHAPHRSLLTALDRALTSGPCALDREVPSSIWRRALSGPAATFLARPGKELRTRIVRFGALLAGGDGHSALCDRIGLVVEVLHAGSLIVDDVEDGSKERRGAPALHELVGVPLAINTGSWMYFWALAELAELDLPPSLQLEAQRTTIRTLARCHEGQALDLAVKVCDLDPVEVRRVVASTTRLKTGALCRLAAELGAIAAGATPERREAIGAFGEEMGMGLQMLDDVGSITSPARRDKGLEDVVAGRPTWPWAWLAEESPFGWSRLADKQRAVLAGSGNADELLDQLGREIGASGREEAHATLMSALTRLIGAVGSSDVTDDIAVVLDRMEASYG
jgi:geranylgeranyl pyrophosphate synthase